MSSSVLYDAPGPKARVRNRIYTVAGSLAVLGLIAFTLYRMNVKGQLEPEVWNIFNNAGVRTSIRDGVLTTLKVFAVAGVLSLVLGLLLAVARLSEHKTVRWAATGFIELFRAIPLLITIYALWFLFLTYKTSLGVVGDNTAFWALVIGLTVYNGCVQAEVIRAGVNAVPRGQVEAAYALGLRKSQVMTMLLLPQAVRSMLPTMISQLVVTLKDTSLGYIITYSELLFAARTMASNIIVNGENPITAVVIVVGAIYVAL
jgi:glutamate transport system permease protein